MTLPRKRVTSWVTRLHHRPVNEMELLRLLPPLYECIPILERQESPGIGTSNLPFQSQCHLIAIQSLLTLTFQGFNMALTGH